jgi:hypothetical protein
MPEHVETSIDVFFCGAGGVTRTRDLTLTKRLLYQLSYASLPGSILRRRDFVRDRSASVNYTSARAAQPAS